MTSIGADVVLDRMESDEAFAQRVKDAGGPEASLAILKDEGFEVTALEMRDAVIDRYGDQLPKEQLDALAAGRGVTGDDLVWMAGGAATAASAAVAAAAV